ncbi:hypothetical protein AB4Z54_37280, partial [Streptomyces sp. MCAF7]
RQCRSLGVTLLPTVVTAAFEPDPYVGVALAARTTGALDAAEAVVRSSNEVLGRMFLDTGVSASGPSSGASSRRTRRARRQRS